ncbi:M48 family metallopeptidase [Candidatus Saccharibacteria bacterium]|nr:M48 family metallopeptidase [Candidatus Saccharibacteria bacterium]
MADPEGDQTPILEHPAVRQANRFSDYVVYSLVLIFSIVSTILLVGFGLMAALLAEESADLSTRDHVLPWPFEFLFNNLGLLIIAIILLFFVMIMVRMMRQMYLSNALQVEYSDFAWLREWSNRVAKDLAMPEVEVMITQDPVMNAFAFGFMKPYTIVLHSGTVRWMSKKHLKAIVVHEMAHIKYKHTAMSMYASLLRMIPVVGGIFGWLLDFWSRRCEFTSDRLALAYLKDKDLIKEALICVHVGPDVASSFGDIAQQWQVYKTRGTFNRFTQTFSGHPFLVRRLQHIDRMSVEYGLSKKSKDSSSDTESEGYNGSDS